MAALDFSKAVGASRSEFAIKTTGISQMTGDLGKIAEAMKIARAMLANMGQNLVIGALTAVECCSRSIPAPSTSQAA